MSCSRTQHNDSAGSGTTVNTEIFASVLHSHMRSFVIKKSSRNGEITLLFTDICKLCPSCDFSATIMSFNAYRENKILAKISGFTV